MCESRSPPAQAGVFELELYRRDGQYIGKMDWAWDDVTRWLQELKRDECMPRTSANAGSSRDTALVLALVLVLVLVLVRVDAGTGTGTRTVAW